MIPLRSPYGLIQEDLWPNEWLILVSCILLNCTTRQQVEKVFPEFIKRWPSPQEFIKADKVDIANLIGPLGFCRRRTVILVKMTNAYLEGNWSHASELPGIGVYGARCWEMLCRGIVGEEPPEDHALVRYWAWAHALTSGSSSGSPRSDCGG